MSEPTAPPRLGVSDVLVLLGAGVVIVQLWHVYRPLAVVAIGAALVIAGLLWRD